MNCLCDKKIINSEEELMKEYLEREKIDYTLSENDTSYLKNKKVLVTGGGGAIGSHLARQLTELGVSKIFILDNHENGLYDVKRYFENHVENKELLQCLLGDIRDKNYIENIIETLRPDIIFHYANYKSAALGNFYPREFIKVNIEGTINLLKAGRDSGIEKFIFISSDKAEQPSQSYGRTKRACEILISIILRNTGVKYGAMRYCNVLDSKGSFAIPTFREQILKGLPVTVRKVGDSEIPKRYFIKKSTAVKLALKVGSLCNKGEIFSINKEIINSIYVDDVVKIIAKKLGVDDVENWFHENVKYISGEKGEKVKEHLGKGIEVSDTPLIIIENPFINEEKKFISEIDKLLIDVNQFKVTNSINYLEKKLSDLELN
ncbi:SDR family NAD(P)-dependent oxidoreductase [uncultured Ilyobacter sp.]|uniref:SDR family NAD(P)-dependent oxidoreductase n=1 Tax=uncultured Ilyobacter sp. TaxID=544433 RepID=UPI0029C6E4B7|nr:SDR family NAD(P)-dependent oxidoreductase [uncultured Ilyobacter sp.]